VSIDQVGFPRRNLGENHGLRHISQLDLRFIEGRKAVIEVIHGNLHEGDIGWVALDMFKDAGDIELENAIRIELVALIHRARDESCIYFKSLDHDNLRSRTYGSAEAWNVKKIPGS